LLRQATLNAIYQESGCWFTYDHSDNKIFLSINQVKTLCPIVDKFTEDSVKRFTKIKPSKNFHNCTFIPTKNIKDIYNSFLKIKQKKY
jgi:hypothetical protein